MWGPYSVDAPCAAKQNASQFKNYHSYAMSQAPLPPATTIQDLQIHTLFLARSGTWLHSPIPSDLATLLHRPKFGVEKMN